VHRNGVLARRLRPEFDASIVDLRPSTKARDLGYLERYVLPGFGTLELGQIDHMSVRAWVAELRASGLSPATTIRTAQILGKIMKAAVQAGLLIKSPCDGIGLPRIERTEMRFLDATEVRALATAIDPRYKATALLAAFRGLRAGELWPSGSTRCGAPSPLPKPWSTSAVIPTSGHPRPEPDIAPSPCHRRTVGRVKTRYPLDQLAPVGALHLRRPSACGGGPVGWRRPRALWNGRDGWRGPG
jgi:hypothetical protein